MLGSLRWNFAMGVSGFLLTMLFSMGSNDFAVSCLRGVYAFVAFFILALLFRFVLFLIAGNAQNPELPVVDEGKGGQLDISTPDEGEDLNELLKAQLDGGLPLQHEESEFRPLTPQKLVSGQNRDPDELAQAIRHLVDRHSDNDKN